MSVCCVAMTTLRTRVAAALLAGTALLLLGDAVAPLSPGLAKPLVLALAYGVLAYGALRARAWARWLGLGVALSVTLLAALDGDWILAALHAPLPLLLARPDDTHPRTAVTLLLGGAALVPVLALSTSAALGFAPAGWLLVAAGLLTVAALVGLARERTWGLAVAGLAGLALLAHPFVATAASAGACSCARAAWPAYHTLETALGLLLVAAALPFAGPVVRFFRR